MSIKLKFDLEAFTMGATVAEFRQIYPCKPIEVLKAFVDEVGISPLVVYEDGEPTTPYTLDDIIRNAAIELAAYRRLYFVAENTDDAALLLLRFIHLREIPNTK